MLHHPQVQLISQSHTNYQLTNSHNIDNSPEVLDNISQLDKIQFHFRLFMNHADTNFCYTDVGGFK